MTELSKAGTATLADAARACDRGEKDAPCTAKAVFAYQWDWGEQGQCCAVHAQLLQQVASQINRTINLYPLQPAVPEPLTRDERTKLKAAVLVLQEELDEAKSRGLELYRATGQLQGDVKLLKVRNTEAEAQLRDARAEVAQLHDELEKRDRENAQLVLELDRLRSLESFTAGERAEAERRELGLSDDPSGSTISG